MDIISEIQVLKGDKTIENQVKIILVQPLPPSLPADTPKEELEKIWEQFCYSDAVAIKTGLIELLPPKTQKILAELLRDKEAHLEPPKVNHKKAIIGVGILFAGVILAAMNLHPLWTAGWVLAAIIGAHLWTTGEPPFFS